MKLIQFFENPSSSPGGTEKVMERIAEVATSLGYDCDEVYESQYPLRPISSRFTMLNPLGNICQMSWWARRRLAQADIIVSHGIYGPFLRSKRRIHVLHSTHSGTADAMRPHIPSLDYRVARHLWGGLFERASLRAERCVAVSNSVVHQASSYYSRECQLIPNTISDVFRELEASQEQLRVSLELPLSKKILLVVGRRERIKGWGVVRGLLDQLPEDVILLSIGQGEALEHPRLLTRSAITPSQLVEFYNAVDWVVSPSLYEGFGLTLLEAWQCATPVIASPTGVALDLSGQEPRFDACLAECSDSPEALLAAISRALRQEDQGRGQVLWGQSMIDRHYSRNRFHSEWSALLGG